MLFEYRVAVEPENDTRSLMTRHPRDLSAGERLCLVLAIQLSARPRVLLVDEPSRGLDDAARRLVGEAMERAADILWQARIAEKRLEILPEESRPRSLDEGYAIQDLMAARCGQKTAGWKIAATSEAGPRHHGVRAPPAGRRPDRAVDGWPGIPGAPSPARWWAIRAIFPRIANSHSPVPIIPSGG